MTKRTSTTTLLRRTTWEVLWGLSFVIAVHGTVIFLTWMF